MDMSSSLMLTRNKIGELYHREELKELMDLARTRQLFRLDRLFLGIIIDFMVPGNLSLVELYYCGMPSLGAGFQ